MKASSSARYSSTGSASSVPPAWTILRNSTRRSWLIFVSPRGLRLATCRLDSRARCIVGERAARQDPVTDMPSASETLASFAAGIDCDRLPAAVVAKVKLHLLDVLGVALAGASMEFGAAVWRAAVAMGGPPTCTVIGFRERLPAAWAALVNGTLAHGLDYDDPHAESVVHVSASVTPAALAVAEEAA